MICFAGVGQDGDLRDLQKSLYFQLTNSQLPANLREESEVFAALQTAAVDKSVLCVIDDAWQLNQVQLLNFIDPRTNSRTLVTTRISGLVPGALAEFSLGLLEQEDAVALLFEVAGARTVPPYEPLAYRACDACGRLPLVLAVAGGMLAEAGGRLTEDFVRLLQEDHGEVLREGDFGDEHVKIEDRLISASLWAYEGAEREQVVQLFTAFAIFPEDVPIPRGFFDALAGAVFGGKGKRPHLMVRSWLTALLRLSLLSGSMADGVYQHDILRDYARARCADLQSQQRLLVETLLGEARPAKGWPSEDAVTRQTAEWYVVTYASWHIC